MWEAGGVRAGESSKFDPRVPRFIKKKLSLLAALRFTAKSDERTAIATCCCCCISLAEVWTVCVPRKGAGTIASVRIAQRVL
jgi:hypothetical protein